MSVAKDAGFDGDALAPDMKTPHWRVERDTRASKVMALGICLVTVALAMAPWMLSAGAVSILVEFLYFLALAQLWNLLAGYAGIISLGQHAYIGIGGYALFALTMLLGVPPLLALLLAGVIAALLAVPIALVVFRLKGAHLAIGTWVVAEVLKLSFAQVAVLGAGSGVSLPAEVVEMLGMPPIERDTVIFFVAFLLAAAANLGAYVILRSRIGLALTAIRDNEVAALSSGVDSSRVKFAVYVAVAFATALIGALIYLTKFRISPAAAFDINWTSYVIFIVVIGGVGTLEGPIIGTIVFFVLREYLADLGGWYLIILGGVAVVIMLKMPAGIWGMVATRFDLHLFALRRRLVPIDQPSRSSSAETSPRRNP